MPTCLKLKVNLLQRAVPRSVQNSSLLRGQMAIQDSYHVSQALFLVALKVSAMGPKFSVLCHVATGSYWFHIMA